MPTYDYECDACGHKFEQFQMMSDKVLRKCPQCGKLKLRRLIGTGAGILFKGSGFYETDYRSDSYKAGEKAESEAKKPKEESKSGSESKTSSESKPSKPKTKKKKSSD